MPDKLQSHQHFYFVLVRLQAKGISQPTCNMVATESCTKSQKIASQLYLAE